MSTIKVNAIQNTSGVEQYLCKAWVNFNGTGTVAIRASGNVTSITDNGTGDYTINFTNALADANFSCVGCSGDTASVAAGRCCEAQAPATSSVRVKTFVVSTGALNDYVNNNVAIFR